MESSFIDYKRPYRKISRFSEPAGQADDRGLDPEAPVSIRDNSSERKPPARPLSFQHNPERRAFTNLGLFDKQLTLMILLDYAFRQA